MPIGSSLEDCTTFEPHAISTMSRALEEACTALHIADSQSHEREVIATRIIDLARTGVIDARALCDRALSEAKTAT